ncbi:DUF1801 domain-containing protein [Cyclobacterium sp.]|uniref:iron chaperone n=1 Tax=Cyclobacterium sp. TaxID=1966343 RepID=UPI0019A24B4F|nr:DUF1801 domain-containing protein [Cyclobacterium sp.]MBD3628478.1 DUF1801 domain-containing protein [Cyclobacterium sp.]
MDVIDKYMAGFPRDVQDILQHIRKIIKACAPGAEEIFSCGMPGYKTLGKPLVYFAAFKNHIGFYATPSGHAEFERELAPYKQGKGSVQFPLTKPIPFDLIERMVVFRVEENEKNRVKK